ncbi:hypothetical protein ACFV4N_11105 [Actinosynnema sp. NPDC059797]
MVRLIPVLERSFADCPFWPAEGDGFHLVVPRRPSSGQVGALVWALVTWAATDDDGEVVAGDAAEAVARCLAVEGEDDFAAGGLRVVAGDLVLDPGCCVGLDEWRGWLEVAAGGQADLGHDPAVWVEHRGQVVHLSWCHDDDRPTGVGLDVPRADLRALLGEVRADLLGFLAALDPWARRAVPGLADRLVAHVDRRLAIGAPL